MTIPCSEVIANVLEILTSEPDFNGFGWRLLRKIFLVQAAFKRACIMPAKNFFLSNNILQNGPFINFGKGTSAMKVS